MDEHVEDLAAVQHVAQDAVGPVGVHVDLVVGVGAHEELAVAHGAQVLEVGLLVEVLAVGMEEELGAVAELGSLPVVVDLYVDDVGDLRLGARGGDAGVEVRDLARLALVGVDEGLDEGREAEGAGVDDAVLLEDGQEVGGAGDGLVGLHHDGVEGLLGRGLGPLHLVRPGRDVLEHGEDGALDGLAHGLEGHLDAVAQRRGDVRRGGVRALGAGEALGHAAQDLAGDDARVATGAHERAMGDGLGDVVHRGVGGERLDLLHHRAQGEGHVGARVAVRDREDVELVDLVRLVGDDLGGDGEAAANGVGNHDLENLGSSRIVGHA